MLAVIVGVASGTGEGTGQPNPRSLRQRSVMRSLLVTTGMEVVARPLAIM